MNFNDVSITFFKIRALWKNSEKAIWTKEKNLLKAYKESTQRSPYFASTNVVHNNSAPVVIPNELKTNCQKWQSTVKTEEDREVKFRKEEERRKLMKDQIKWSYIKEGWMNIIKS